jgi:NitT/TauT family transport system permease protein
MRKFLWLYQVMLLAVLLGAWHVLTAREVLSSFFFGKPLLVVGTLYDWFGSGSLFKHLGITLLETLLAFVVGTALGVGFGLWLGLSAWVAALLEPYIKAFNAMPRVVLAPIFAMWFGLGIWSKVALGVTLVFFIVFFNVFQGVKDVNPVLIANARMLGASRRQLVRHVYWPSALSWVFSSLHASVGMAFVGAVVGEYLGSAQGVGYLILQAEGSFDINAVLAGLVVLSVCALGLDGLISRVERSLLRWRPKAASSAF